MTTKVAIRKPKKKVTVIDTVKAGRNRHVPRAKRRGITGNTAEPVRGIRPNSVDNEVLTYDDDVVIRRD